MIALGLACFMGSPAKADPVVDGCRKSAGVTGTVSFSAPAFLAMNNCVSQAVRKIDSDRAKIFNQLRTYQQDIDQRLIVGRGKLAARSCQEEMANRQYVESLLIQIPDMQRRFDQNAAALKRVYDAYGIELTLLYAGGAGSDPLGKMIGLLNQEFEKKNAEIQKQRRAFRNFYVDLQGVQFQDACSGRARVGGTPVGPMAGCQWRPTTAAGGGRGHMCVCRDASAPGGWRQEPDGRRCGPHGPELPGMTGGPGGAGGSGMAGGGMGGKAKGGMSSPGDWQPIR